MRAIMFTDIVDSTGFVESRGDRDAIDHFAAHRTMVRECVRDHAGQFVKWTGDGVVCTFPLPGDAVGCGIAIQHLSRFGPSPIPLRIGISAGQVLADGAGDYFGILVTLAKRLCDAATAGDILCSDVVRGSLLGKRALGFEYAGPHDLKGLAEATPAYRVLFSRDLASAGAELEAIQPRTLARLAIASAWGIDPGAPGLAVQAAEALAASHGSEEVADFLGEIVAALRDSGFPPESVRPLIRRGLTENGDRRGPAWMVFAINQARLEPERYAGATPQAGGADIEMAEEIGRGLTAAERERWGFRFPTPKSRDEALRAGTPELLLWYCGEYQAALPRLRAQAAVRETAGRVARAIDSWSFVARCCASLGLIEEGRDALRRARRLLRGLPARTDFAFQVEGAAADVRYVLGTPLTTASLQLWEATVFGSPRTWVFAMARSLLALGYAELGITEQAVAYVDELIESLEAARAGSDDLCGVVHRAIEALWRLGIARHDQALEAVVRTKVLGPDFRQQLTDGRLSMARLEGLRGNWTSALGWLNGARSILRSEGSRPLLAICDLDHALLLARSGDDPDRYLRLAESQFQELEMPGWLGRVSEIRAGFAARRQAG